jgi:hypothetical protein
MRSDDTDNRGVRWRRWNFPKPVATPRTDTGAYTKPDAIPDSDADAHADPDAHADTDTGRHSVHDYVQRRVAEIADGITGFARDIHQQRHPRT